MTPNTFPWVKLFFITTTIILAGFKLLAEIVSEQQKENIVNKIALVKVKLDTWTPKAYFEMFHNRWLLGILQFFLSLALLPLVMHQISRSEEFIFAHFTDHDLQTILTWYYNAVAYIEQYFVLQVVVALCIAIFASESKYDPDMDFSPETLIGDGSMLKFWAKLGEGIMQMLMYAAFYWGCYWFSNLKIDNLLYQIASIFAVLVIFISPIIYLFKFMIIIFNSLAALIVILLSYISNIPVFFLKHVFNWIYANPKKAWAVMLASLALVLTLDKIPTLFKNP